MRGGGSNDGFTKKKTHNFFVIFSSSNLYYILLQLDSSSHGKVNPSWSGKIVFVRNFSLDPWDCIHRDRNQNDKRRRNQLNLSHNSDLNFSLRFPAMQQKFLDGFKIWTKKKRDIDLLCPRTRRRLNDEEGKLQTTQNTRKRE